MMISGDSPASTGNQTTPINNQGISLGDQEASTDNQAVSIADERFSPCGPSVGRFPIRARIPTPCPVLTPVPLSLRKRGNDGEEKESCMRAQLRRRLEMAERVRDFLRTHQTDGVGQGLGLA